MKEEGIGGFVFLGGGYVVLLGFFLLFNKNPGRESSLLLAKYLIGSQMSNEDLFPQDYFTMYLWEMNYFLMFAGL